MCLERRALGACWVPFGAKKPLKKKKNGNDALIGIEWIDWIDCFDWID